MGDKSNSSSPKSRSKQNRHSFHEMSGRALKKSGGGNAAEQHSGVGVGGGGSSRDGARQSAASKKKMMASRMQSQSSLDYMKPAPAPKLTKRATTIGKKEGGYGSRLQLVRNGKRLLQ
eukprot:TRINITY_DN5121_c1_g1_i2.p1 TRINITY_DN5121_c1_g1~~TRINITY_DN5121_c1_g1_i2.p1  ORF type:complete len:118 (-),score=19.82 TRINITY_DN5121_c1_g1_i2:38-391(-)